MEETLPRLDSLTLEDGEGEGGEGVPVPRDTGAAPGPGVEPGKRLNPSYRVRGGVPGAPDATVSYDTKLEAFKNEPSAIHRWARREWDKSTPPRLVIPSNPEGDKSSRKGMFEYNETFYKDWCLLSQQEQLFYESLDGPNGYRMMDPAHYILRIVAKSLDIPMGLLANTNLRLVDGNNMFDAHGRSGSDKRKLETFRKARQTPCELVICTFKGGDSTLQPRIFTDGTLEGQANNQPLNKGTKGPTVKDEVGCYTPTYQRIREQLNTLLRDDCQDNIFLAVLEDWRWHGKYQLYGDVRYISGQSGQCTPYGQQERDVDKPKDVDLRHWETRELHKRWINPAYKHNFCEFDDVVLIMLRECIDYYRRQSAGREVASLGRDTNHREWYKSTFQTYRNNCNPDGILTADLDMYQLTQGRTRIDDPDPLSANFPRILEELLQFNDAFRIRIFAPYGAKAGSGSAPPVGARLTDVLSRLITAQKNFPTEVDETYMYRFERDEGARFARGAFGDIAMFRANDLFQDFQDAFLRDFTGYDAQTDRQKMLGAARGTWDYERLQPSPPGWPILPRTDLDPVDYWNVGLKRVKYMQTYLTQKSKESLLQEWLDWARVKTPQDDARVKELRVELSTEDSNATKDLRENAVAKRCHPPGAGASSSPAP